MADEQVVAEHEPSADQSITVPTSSSAAIWDFSASYVDNAGEEEEVLASITEKSDPTTSAAVLHFVTRRRSIHELCDNDDDPFIPHNTYNRKSIVMMQQSEQQPLEESQLHEVNMSNNSLINTLGVDIIQSGAMPIPLIAEKVDLIQQAFEDGHILDDELIEAIKYEEFTIISFLLAVITSKVKIGCEDKVARCLAFAGNIYTNLWPDYAFSQLKVILLLRVASNAVERIQELVHALQCHAERLANERSDHRHGGYLGYDSRDIADYNIQGYDHPEEQQGDATAADAVARMEDCIMVWLLLLSQLFGMELPSVRSNIQFSRSKWNKNADELIDFEEDTNLTIDSAENLNMIDLVNYFRYLVESLLSLTGKLPEAAYLYAMKVIAAINSQFPPLKSSTSTEVAECFARYDSPESHSNLSQGLLHVLNENGYPEVSMTETPAMIRLCIDILNVEDYTECENEVLSLQDSMNSSIAGVTGGEVQENEDDGMNESSPSAPPRPPPPPPPRSGQIQKMREKNRSSVRDSMISVAAFARGHFYTNDIKVLIDIIIRELRNIPHFSDSIVSSSGSAALAEVYLYGTLRLLYLRLFEAILTKSSWSSSGDCYMREHLKPILEEIIEKDADQQSGKYASELKEKYSYYID